MVSPRLRRCCLPAVLALCALAYACDSAAPGSGAGPPVAAAVQDDLQDRLAGTWLRERTERGVRSRHLLILEPDGSFRETVRVTDAAGVASDFVHEGTWLYDGTNLKRKYTLMRGRPPSRLNLPFATFQVEFVSRNEFVGVDHIHGNRIRYTRVAPETEL